MAEKYTYNITDFLNNTASLEMNSCVNPRFDITVLGQEFNLTGINSEVESFVAQSEDGFTNGIKMKLSLTSDVITAFREELHCDFFNNPVANADQAPKDANKLLVGGALCPTLGVMETGSLWAVLSNEAMTSNDAGEQQAIQSQLIFGLGEFPVAGSQSQFPFVSSKFRLVNSGPVPINPLVPIEISNATGNWGGWNGSQSIDLCSRQLCSMQDFTTPISAPVNN